MVIVVVVCQIPSSNRHTSDEQRNRKQKSSVIDEEQKERINKPRGFQEMFMINIKNECLRNNTHPFTKPRVVVFMMMILSLFISYREPTKMRIIRSFWNADKNREPRKSMKKMAVSFEF